jgi:hypothetical protein
MLGIQGLLPLLMKQRNGNKWTPDERAQLRCHLRSLTSLSPYFLVFLLPGSFILFSVLAWWLDRRRQKRNSSGKMAHEVVPATIKAERSSPPSR